LEIGGSSFGALAGRTVLLRFEDFPDARETVGFEDPFQRRRQRLVVGADVDDVLAVG